MAERSAEFASLQRRAEMVTSAFQSLPHMTCVPTQGGMYSFPSLELPPKAIAAAKAAGKQPDTFYCLKLLEQEGISTTPGSGFGQAEGSFHFRTTILPREEVMKTFVEKVVRFHDQFMETYKD